MRKAIGPLHSVKRDQYRYASFASIWFQQKLEPTDGGYESGTVTCHLDIPQVDLKKPHTRYRQAPSMG